MNEIEPLIAKLSSKGKILLCIDNFDDMVDKSKEELVRLVKELIRFD